MPEEAGVMGVVEQDTSGTREIAPKKNKELVLSALCKGGNAYVPTKDILED
ncbi:MAG: hypothetical protein Q4F57_06560 [Weeksellaceae bacterium]|nr:hypothetical protein [Weeksellaceae bacterium]